MTEQQCSEADQALIDALRDAVGRQAVLTSADELQPHLEEWRRIERGYCVCAVRPGSTQEVAAVMRICHERQVPVTTQGGNTGMVAGALPQGGVVLLTNRLATIRAIDRDNATMTVEAGCILATAQAAAREQGLLFPVSLASEGSCHVGGAVATNAGGNNTVRFGNTRENVLGLEVVLADGRTWDGLRGLRKNNTGYDLKHLFIGSEGTLGVITAVVFRLVPEPAARETVMAACPTVASVTTLYQRLQKAVGDQILAYEMLPDAAIAVAEHHVDSVRSPFDQRHPWYVLLELSHPEGLGDLRQGLEGILASAMEDGLVTDAVVAESDSQAAALWHIRETVPEAQSMGGAVIKHDVSVPISAIPEFLERGTELLLEHIPEGTVVPFGHVGDGNIHFNVLQPDDMERAAFLELAPAVHLAMHELTVSLNGSFSAEHGIGLEKTADMSRFRPAVELDMMRAVKEALDPRNIMNPGKLLP